MQNDEMGSPASPVKLPTPGDATADCDRTCYSVAGPYDNTTLKMITVIDDVAAPAQSAMAYQDPLP
ncbi:hypothetical protein PQI07_32210 [Methylobacterium sp. 092160098-2]|uniref:hypothetical protein n=1 Tax=Methylobacterium sp. 092160098-2 TaxID=3025129 RepID=UPI002381A6EB|nr:hypothetical protein [Methylobacterium sp. 092160098-2]MDE4915251.1 hypothetical protein [Methylobacterium sp. 092160098-2]